jgi:membrane protease YdiL (CAAX protease family)
VSASRRLRVEPADAVRAGVPLLLLGVAVALPSLAAPVVLLLVAGVTVAAGRRAPVVWAWAAGVPAAAIATIRAFGPAASAWDAATCTAVGSPPVVWAIAEVVAVGAIVVTLALLLGARPGDLALRMPPKYARPWALTGFVAILGGGLAGVVLLARPVFGLPDVDLGGPGFVVPAAAFAIALAVSEELAWRGALQGWLARTLGTGPAALVQGVVYGIAWGVLLGSPLGGLLAGSAGVILGATVVRTRSLAVALAWHAAFNVPLYAFIACRAG